MSSTAESERSLLPRKPIDYLVAPVVRFMHVEAMGGIVLLLVTVIALMLANSPVSKEFLGFWKTTVGVDVGSWSFRHPLKHLVNDGLMVIFFFVVGLEVKRELVMGELRGVRRATLPLAAALGGMIVPAAIYLAIEAGTPAARGWGIPMATDIAFVVGCMAILGSRVPHGLRVMLLSLAIADDIGAILVIAIGYTSNMNFAWLAVGFAGFAVIVGLIRLGVRSIFVYAIVSLVIWYAFHESGVHATIAGVILGLLTPTRSLLDPAAGTRLMDRARELLTGHPKVEAVSEHRKLSRELVSPLDYFIHALHPWVSFVIMPVFALANAGVIFDGNNLASSVAVAVIVALFAGKTVGVFVACQITVRLRLAELPTGVTWPQILGGSALAGIGFTMALFVASLALQGDLLDQAKVGVLAGSLVSATVGMIILFIVGAKKKLATDEHR